MNEMINSIAFPMHGVINVTGEFNNLEFELSDDIYSYSGAISWLLEKLHWSNLL